MVALTMEEQRLIDKICRSAPLSARLMKISLIGLVVALLGGGGIILSTAWRLAEGEINWDEFLNALGLWVVVCSFVWMLWHSGRTGRVVHSTLFKLYKMSYCGNCGQGLPVDECRSCGRGKGVNEEKVSG